MSGAIPLPPSVLVWRVGEHSRSLDGRVIHQSHDVAEDATDTLQLRILHARETHELTTSPLVLYSRGLFCFSGASDPSSRLMTLFPCGSSDTLG
jgi:hypothetical protein